MYRARFVLALTLLAAGLLAILSSGSLAIDTLFAQGTGNVKVYLPFVSKSPYTDTFPEANPLILGTCSAQVHDRYVTVGPDGRLYRTWHPVRAPIDANNPNGSKCTFAHEHGDPPHPSGPLPPFGYASAKQGMFTEITAHPGFKVFTHYANGNSGFGYPERDYGGLPIDFTLTIHQGSGGRARLTTRHHSFELWSRYNGRETRVFVMSDTGNLIGKQCLGGGPEPARVVVDQCDPAYELWPFQVNIGGAWRSGAMLAAVTNPMNHMRGQLPCTDATCSSVTLASTSETFCGHQLAPCSEKLPFGKHGARENFWLGHMRTIHEPDWVWSNAGRAETFCTDPFGTRQSCSLPNSIAQRVAPVNVSNERASELLRTNNESGWYQTVGLPVGAPGGN